MIYKVEHPRTGLRHAQTCVGFNRLMGSQTPIDQRVITEKRLGTGLQE